MDYKSKYIKYKNKYTILKNQYGKGKIEISFEPSSKRKLYRAPKCVIPYKPGESNKKKLNCNMELFNRFGTCWMIAIFVVFILSDSTSECVQYLLFNMSNNDIINSETNILLKSILPEKIFGKAKEIFGLISYIKLKFGIKIDDITHCANTLDNNLSTDNLSTDNLSTDNYNPASCALRRHFSEVYEKDFAEIVYELFI